MRRTPPGDPRSAAAQPGTHAGGVVARRMRCAAAALTLASALLVAAAMAGCTRESPPRPVTDYLDDPALLQATLERCSRLSDGRRDDADCVNARLAAQRLSTDADVPGREQQRARQDAEGAEGRDARDLRRDRLRPSPDAPLRLAPEGTPPPVGVEPPPASRTGPAPPAGTQGSGEVDDG